MDTILSMVERLSAQESNAYRNGYAAGYMAGKADRTNELAYGVRYSAPFVEKPDSAEWTPERDEQLDEIRYRDEQDDDVESREELPGH